MWTFLFLILLIQDINLLCALSRWNSITKPDFSLHAEKAWNGAGLTQEDLLLTDECILVDEHDRIIGHDSKYNSHLFTVENPQGKLHRAFSVLIFNRNGELLLQQRAAGKVTFPLVWTNACCSHPLYGYQPSEVDSEEDIVSGRIPGMRSAAIRKLEHELGIQAKAIAHDNFKFLTRVRYWASDGGKTPSSGGDVVWGEHEVDYILFLRGDYELHPNAEEVASVKYVNKAELKAMMEDPKLKWSPWFRAIVERFLDMWWDHLDGVFSTDKFNDLSTVHYLTCK
eukprot:gene10421-11539_t